MNLVNVSGFYVKQLCVIIKYLKKKKKNPCIPSLLERCALKSTALKIGRCSIKN